MPGTFIRRLPRVAVASLAAFATDVIILTLAFHAGAPTWLAALLGCAAGGLVNFAVSKAHVFRAAGKLPGALLRYFAFVVSGCTLWTALLMQAGVSLGAPLFVTRVVVALLVVFAWSYPVASRLVFATGRRCAPPPKEKNHAPA